MRGSWRACAVFALLVGCGKNGSPDVDVTSSNLCDEVAEVACHDMYDCCSEGEIESVLGVDEPRTEGQCREDIAVVCRRGVATRDWSVENGRATFNPAAATTCLDALLAQDECEVVGTAVPWAEECVTALWTGTVADGGQCFYQYECANPDSRCTANRVCTPLPGDGMACASGQCASGLFCNANVCRPRRAAGEACTSNIACQAGLFCDQNADPDPVCAPLRPLAAPCQGNGTCASQFCIPGVCAGTTQTCLADTECNGRCADDGSFCTTASQCQLGTCMLTPAQVCSSPAQCVGGAGDTCVFPVACTPGDCVGEPVCGENYFATDFCEDALGDFPVVLTEDRPRPL